MQEYVRISTTLDSEIDIGTKLRVLILDFFPGPMFLSKSKALCFFNFWKKIQTLWIFSSFIVLQHKFALDAHFVSQDFFYHVNSSKIKFLSVKVLHLLSTFQTLPNLFPALRLFRSLDQVYNPAKLFNVHCNTCIFSIYI